MQSNLDNAVQCIGGSDAKVVTTKRRIAWKVDLTLEEAARYQTMIDTGEGVGVANIPELLRLLLARDYNRRHKLGPPKPWQWQTAARIGRPAKNKLTI